MHRAVVALEGSPTPRLDAEVLVAHALRKSRGWLFAHADEVLEPDVAESLLRLVARRAAGQPVAHLTGVREFWSLPLRITPEVLIPRPETELLVELALRHVPQGARTRIADLGTGSGAIALALASERPAAFVVATDANAAALDVARHNARSLGIGKDRIIFREGDWFVPLAEERFDLVVSNPPYVRSNDPHLEDGDVRFEPRAALDGGADGLSAVRRIVRGAPAHLSPGGALVLEHGHDQQDAVVAVITEAHPGASVRCHTDHAGLSRAIVTRFP